MVSFVQVLAQQAEVAKRRARELLDTVVKEQQQETFIQECERLLLQGSSINVHLDEIADVQKIVTREQLITELDDAERRNDPGTILEDI